METRFPKFEEGEWPGWILHLHAGEQWLTTYELVRSAREDQPIFLHWVEPYALFFSVELFVKANVGYYHREFVPKSYGHKVSKIIEAFANTVPQLLPARNDPGLMELIREFENTVDTRFGETAVSMGEGTARMYDFSRSLRNQLEELRKNDA